MNKFVVTPGVIIGIIFSYSSTIFSHASGYEVRWPEHCKNEAKNISACKKCVEANKPVAGSHNKHYHTKPPLTGKCMLDHLPRRMDGKYL